MPDEAQTIFKPQAGPQEMFFRSKAQIVIYGGSAGGGKQLPLETPIPTPAGWKNMGDLKIRDQIFDEFGNVCCVTKVHPIDRKPESFRVRFDDGSYQDACADHLWLTFDAKELNQLTTRAWSKERRAKHNLTRTDHKGPGGKKSAAFTKMITERNKNRNKKYLALPSGTVRSTKEIQQTLLTKSGRRNHAVPVTKPLDLPEVDLAIDPYVLGVWLGDGNKNSGMISAGDIEVIENLRLEGEEIDLVPSQAPYGYRAVGLTRRLRSLGVLGKKHIPKQYLRASYEQRLALLQGLMDTDGYIAADGGCNFDTTTNTLYHDVHELLVSMGIKVGIAEGRAKLYDKDCGPVWTLIFTTTLNVFRLSRKLARLKSKCRRVTQFRYIVDCEPIKPRPMRCITVSSASGLFLCGRDMIPTHNSFALLMEPLRNVTTNAKFAAVIFRRNSTEHRKPGATWDESMGIYGNIDGAVPVQHRLEWNFTKGGGKIVFAHLEYDSTVLEWHSAQVPLIEFDELTEFTRYQFFYMLTRNRSISGVHPYIRAGCNPDADSWVAEFISWWIDQETGYPIMARAGVLRWFIRVGDELIWRDHKEELSPELLGLPTHDKEGRVIPYMPKSVTFIPSSIYDNQVLMQQNPEYLANLLAQPTVERERLLRGNWKIKPSAGLYFKRSWVKVIKQSEVPPLALIKRGWDLASTEKTSLNDPDWTCGTKIGKGHDGNYYVIHHTYIQRSPGDVERHLKVMAAGDGRECIQHLPKDPGQAGKWQVQHLQGTVAAEGYALQHSPESGDKAVRFAPFSSAAQAGKVFVVEGDWNDRWFATLEAFPDGTMDDDVDSTSRAYNSFLDSNSGLALFYKQQAEKMMAEKAKKYEGPPKSVEDGGVKIKPPLAHINLLYDQKGNPIYIGEDGHFIVHPEHADLLAKSGFTRVEANVINLSVYRKAANG